MLLRKIKKLNIVHIHHEILSKTTKTNIRTIFSSKKFNIRTKINLIQSQYHHPTTSHKSHHPSLNKGPLIKQSKQHTNTTQQNGSTWGDPQPPHLETNQNPATPSKPNKQAKDPDFTPQAATNSKRSDRDRAAISPD